MRAAAPLILFVVLVLLPAEAYAQTPPEPGLSYRVVGVAPDDKLNIRSDAGTTAPIVGALAPKATGIVVTGVRQRVGDSDWWQVAHKGAAGWVNARFLAPAHADAAPHSGFALLCAGTEPFWSLHIAKGTARFAAPDDKEQWTAGTWRDAVARPPGYHFAIDIAAKSKGKPAWAAISRAEDHCSDGMSDFEHPYSVILSTPTGHVYAGCCARAP